MSERSLSPAAAALDARPTRLSVSTLARLVALYAAQGIPFGFATTYIPLQLTSRPGFTYSQATLLTLANFPWLLKVLWAPAVDTRYVARIGRRRSWILPAQGLIAATALVASFVDFDGPIWVLVTIMVLFNLWASVQDTAVDGLAVELLTDRERGLGNAAQVAGYKLGMVAGGSGLVLLASEHRLGSSGALQVLAGLVLVLILAPLTHREPPPPPKVEQLHGHAESALGLLRRTLSQPGWPATLVFIATVKVGETMVSNVLKPLLVREYDFTREDAAWAVGLVGMVASLAGSVVGGAFAGRYGRLKALAWFGTLQAFTLAALGLALAFAPDRATLVTVIAVEHFAVGLLTPALFAYMMDVSEPAIAATHYGLLAMIELVVKGSTGAISGKLLDALGPTPFVLTVAIGGAAPLLLLSRIRRPLPAPG